MLESCLPSHPACDRRFILGRYLQDTFFASTRSGWYASRLIGVSSAACRRNELILRLLERFTGESYAPYRSRIVWGAVLPQDRSRQVADERALVAAGIHSRRRAADTLGVEDPDAEFARWLEEEGRTQSIGEGRHTGAAEKK